MSRLAALLAVGSLAASAHVTISTKITWSKEISRIVYQRCLTCHREEGKAFSLETYEVARPWAKAIQEEVLMRRMPPWGAVKGFGSFAHDRGLTQEEVNLIAEWAEGGAPEGDKNLLPNVPWKFEEPPAPQGRPMQAPLRVDQPRMMTALEASGPTQVTAVLPDGSVEPLLWVMTPLKQPQVYLLAAPVKLPTGARIAATAPVRAWLTEPKPSRQTGASSPAPRVRTAPTRGALPAGEKSR
jgi:hypothetical protein